MSKVKTITLNGKVSEYDVKYTKAYVAKIISAQSDLYQELIPSVLPYNAVKEIYVDGILEAELVGSSILYVQRDLHKLDNQDLEGTGLRWETTDTEETEEEPVHTHTHTAAESVQVNEEEIEEMLKPENGIYLQSVTSPPPYWVTDTTAGNLDITYTN